MKEPRNTFIRFGKIPENGKSKIFHKGLPIGEEEGLSVFAAIYENGRFKLVLHRISTDVLLALVDLMRERNAYEVSGHVCGEGCDGEPLLDGAIVIAELGRINDGASEKYEFAYRKHFSHIEFSL
jgi:hypothetical protein